MPEIRALENTQRAMQRLGYLKRLIRRVTSLSTSNLDNLGHDLIDTVTRKVRIPLNEARAVYIKQRLYDQTYRTLKAQADAWVKEGASTEPPIAVMELQDLYLADPTLPSRVGKLVKADWDRYPLLGVSLGLIRPGTFSTTTRALSFMRFISDDELQAFLEYKPEANPLCISRHQALLLLYSLLENDGEVIAPLLAQLATGVERFSDRDAGDRLPELFRNIATRHRGRIISADARDRLISLEKSAESIARRREIERYVGSSREHASRVRVEPYADIGLLVKPDLFKYEYAFSPAGRVWAEALKGVESSDAVADFLARRFFSVAAKAWEIDALTLTASDTDKIVTHLQNAWKNIQSPGGYAPIEELALMAGIRALLEHQLVIEPAVAREAIITYQKANPYQVRFTVNRLGVLAHARFLEAPSESLPTESQ